MTPLLSRQRFALLVAFMTLLASIYMFTYSARIEATDTLFMFDATASLVKFGDLRLDMTAGERYPTRYDGLPDDLPLLPVNAEPLQMVLAAPLYWLADTVPGIGAVHTVWLFNVGVSTLAVGVFALYALQLGYSDRTALGGALLLGVGTLVWPYSKTFFQEPLTMLLILLAALLLERWRSSGYRGWLWLLLGLLTLGVSLWARRAAVIALPIYAIIVFPGLGWLFRSRWLRLLLWLSVVAVAVGLYALTVTPIPSESVPPLRLAFNQAIRGYLFSIGGSVWGTSPVLLLALPGMLWLTWRNRMRYVVVALSMLLVYAVGFAHLADTDWFGGLSFPPRFLYPTIPFLLLCALPIVDAALHPKREVDWLVTGGVLIVFAYAVWVQLSAVTYWWGVYPELLPAAANGIIEWSGGLNEIRYLRWVLLPGLWGERPLDFAWARTGQPWLAVMFVCVAAVGVGCMAWLSRAAQPSRQRWVLAGLPIVLLAATGVHLATIYEDDLYLAFSDGLRDAQQAIEENLTEDDLMVIAQLGYERYFLNNELDGVRVVSLPTHPGEQPSPAQAPEVRSANPARLLQKPSLQFVESIAGQYERLWVLYDATRFIPWAVRPFERYMALYYYPLRTIETSGEDGLPVRLVEYVTSARNDAPFTLRGAAAGTDLRFGEQVRLLGYTLPLGTDYAPGEALPLSLLWATDAALDESYVVATYVGQAGVGVVAGAEDSPPYAGFAPTDGWQVGEPVWDNRALRLPEDIPPGEYVLWVGLYAFDAAGSPELLPISGGESAENGTLGVLPVQIQVRASGA